MTDRIVYLFREIKIKGRSQADIARAEGKTESAISKYINRHQADWEQLKQEYAAHRAKETEWEQQVDSLHEKKKELSLWQAGLKNPLDKFTVQVMQTMTDGEYDAELERGPFGKHKEYITYTRDGDPSLGAVEKDKFTPDLLKGA